MRPAVGKAGRAENRWGKDVRFRQSRVLVPCLIDGQEAQVRIRQRLHFSSVRNGVTAKDAVAAGYRMVHSCLSVVLARRPVVGVRENIAGLIGIRKDGEKRRDHGQQLPPKGQRVRVADMRYW